MSAKLLGMGSIDLGGVLVFGSVLGLMFGIPLAALRVWFSSKGERVALFGSTLSASIVAALLVMLAVWALQ
jgi:hypothetical protein